MKEKIDEGREYTEEQLKKELEESLAREYERELANSYQREQEREAYIDWLYDGIPEEDRF